MVDITVADMTNDGDEQEKKQTPDSTGAFHCLSRHNICNEQTRTGQNQCPQNQCCQL